MEQAVWRERDLRIWNSTFRCEFSWKYLRVSKVTNQHLCSKAMSSGVLVIWCRTWPQEGISGPQGLALSHPPGHKGWNKIHGCGFRGSFYKCCIKKFIVKINIFERLNISAKNLFEYLKCNSKIWIRLIFKFWLYSSEWNIMCIKKVGRTTKSVLGQIEVYLTSIKICSI